MYLRMLLHGIPDRLRGLVLVDALLLNTSLTASFNDDFYLSVPVRRQSVCTHTAHDNGQVGLD